jgi:hypothetical protein
VIHGIEMRDPSVPYRGRGVIASILIEHQTYMATLQKQLATMDNLGRPDFLVSTDTFPNPEQQAQLRQQINAMTQGVGKQGKFLIFPKTTSITPMQFPPKDMGESQQLKDLASSIAAAFGIAESSIFLNTANLASAEVGRVETARNAVLPRLQKDAAVLNERLVPMFRDLERRGAWLAYDNPVPEDEDRKATRLVTLVGTVLTPDEARAELGYEPLPDGQGEALRPLMPAPDFGFPATGNPPEKPDGSGGVSVGSDNAEETDARNTKSACESTCRCGTAESVASRASSTTTARVVVQTASSLKSAHAQHTAAWVKQVPTLAPDGD